MRRRRGPGDRHLLDRRRFRARGGRRAHRPVRFSWGRARTPMSMPPRPATRRKSPPPASSCRTAWASRAGSTASSRPPTRGRGSSSPAAASSRSRRRAAGHGHDHGDENDPHAWQSIANAKIYVANIRDGLIAADPAGKEAYTANAAAYVARLDALDRECARPSPKSRRSGARSSPPRRLRLFRRGLRAAIHRPAGHFDRRRALGAVASPASSAQIRQEKIPAVFVENVADTRLAERIAKEGGAKLGGTLYSDSFRPPAAPRGLTSTWFVTI